MPGRALHAAVLAALATLASAFGRDPLVEGIVWQPHNHSLAPAGNWQRLGARRLLVQWTAVDGLAFVAGTGLPTAPRLPDWKSIAREPWADEVILGLAGRFDERAARRDVEELARASRRLARLDTPLNVVGWYFPVEVDPTWLQADRLGALLEGLPRPLWISLYDRANIGPDALAASLAQWLPPDVGVFFQDGVGTHVREPAVARRYADQLVRQFGRERVRLIAEAFRPAATGGFRAATAAELGPQLAAYAGHRVYLFEGPQYVSDARVKQLLDERPPR